jgi:hypothetical protein
MAVHSVVERAAEVGEGSERVAAGDLRARGGHGARPAHLGEQFRVVGLPGAQRAVDRDGCKRTRSRGQGTKDSAVSEAQRESKQ